MEKSTDYNEIIERRAEEVFEVMAPRTSAEDMSRLRRAYEVARKAHEGQWRKSGEPYILHPIAVARIAAEEIKLDVNTIIAAFLHDVVEDTETTIEEIGEMFGSDVEFLVAAVTKKKDGNYNVSKQVDNYKQMLEALRHDVRAVLIKLADRLHNMRTLASMKPHKQMKIAGETDYFYAPLATRLGLYHIKTELENLSFRFRCPHDYDNLCALIEQDKKENAANLETFTKQIREILDSACIKAEVSVEYREPYSLWRKMRKYGDDFNHLKYRHAVDIVFESEPTTGDEEADRKADKHLALKIYSLLTDTFNEKPGGITNYIDSPKENGYRSFHVKLVPEFGKWQEVHISSRRMAEDARLGCVAESSDEAGGISRWVDKFRAVLRDLSEKSYDSPAYIEDVVTSLYNDDIMVFNPEGNPVVLPQKASALDFAYEKSDDCGNRAHYARINGRLSNITHRLKRGDIVEIFESDDAHPTNDWLEAAVTYKARNAIRNYLKQFPEPKHARCQHCKPIPGEEVIGYFDPATKVTTAHKRDCPVVIRLASQWGENIVSVDYTAGQQLYPVTIEILAIDRHHLLADLTDSITNQLGLSMTSIMTEIDGALVRFTIEFAVHSFDELNSIMRCIGKIDGVDEVKEV